MTLKNYRAIFLDLGKVLVDFDLREFGRRILPRAGITAEELRQYILADGLAVAYETGSVGDAGFHQELCRRMKVNVPWPDFVEAWNSIFIEQPVISGDVLDKLRAKAPLWIISNTNKLHFDFIAQRYPFLRKFKGYVLSHEVGAAKPHPRIFQHALSRAGVEPHEALFVDDQAENVESARKMGLDAFQFVSADQFRLELEMRELL